MRAADPRSDLESETNLDRVTRTIALALAVRYVLVPILKVVVYSVLILALIVLVLVFVP